MKSILQAEEASWWNAKRKADREILSISTAKCWPE